MEISNNTMKFPSDEKYQEGYERVFGKKSKQPKEQEEDFQESK